MRTTVDIPDPTYRRLKARAAQEGSSVKVVVLRSIERELEASLGRRRGRKAPLIPSQTPGAMHITNEMIYEIIPFP
jgi:hypothetical protein